MRAVLLGPFLLVVVLLLVGAADLAADERLEKLAAGLRSDDQTERFAAYQALNTETSPALLGILVGLLPDCPEMGQYYGMLVLQRQDPKRLLPALRKLMATSSVHLRVLAAAQLVRLGQRDGAPPIVRALRDDSLGAVQKALLIRRLYSVRDPSVQEAIRALITKDGDPGVLDAALYNVYLVRDAGAREAVRGLFEHADAGIRALAAGCLMALGDQQAASRLAEAIAAGGLTVSNVYTLKSFLSMAGTVPESVLAAFLARLDEETDVNALRAMVDLLGEQGYAKAATAIRKLLDHENALVSKAAFAALVRFPGAITSASMRELLEGGDDARRLAVVEALRRADDLSGLPVALAILKDGERLADRWEAARVLGGFRTAGVVEPLLDALADDNQSVRANAYGSLGTVLRSLFPYRRLDLAATGYTTSATPAANAAAVAKLRAWWQANRDKDW